MPISFEKVVDFIQSRGFICNTFFYTKDGCYFIEMFCLGTSENVLMYIPSKYIFFPSEKVKRFKISFINIENEFDDEQDVSNESIDLDIAKQSNIEQHLEKRYKHGIQLKDIAEFDVKELSGVISQIKRLSFAVENIEYKFAIFYKNYIISLSRNNEISPVMISNHPRSSKSERKRFLIQISLELLYEKSTNIYKDIIRVRDGIYTILKKNQKKHARLLQEVIDEYKDVKTLQGNIENKINTYNGFIDRFTYLNDSITEAQEKLNIVLDLEKGKKTPIFDGESINNKKKLDVLENSRQDIKAYSVLTRDKFDNTILSIDSVLFENIVMIKKISENFQILKKILDSK